MPASHHVRRLRALLVLVAVYAASCDHASATNIEFLLTYSQTVDPITAGDLSDGPTLDNKTIFRTTDCVFTVGNCSIDSTPSGLGVTVTPSVTFPNNGFNPATRGVITVSDPTGIYVEQVVGYADIDAGRNSTSVPDAVHQISETQYLISWAGDVNTPSTGLVASQKEDIVLRTITGGGTGSTSSLFADVTSLFNTNRSENTNAVSLVTSSVWDVIVSFSSDRSFSDLNCGSVVCSNLGSGFSREDLVVLDLTGTTVTGASLFLDDPLDLIQSSNGNPGNIIGVALDPRFDIDVDSLITLFVLRAIDDQGPSIYQVNAYRGGSCVSAIYCVGNVSLFLDGNSSYLNVNAAGGSTSNAALRRVSGLSVLMSATSVPEPSSGALVVATSLGMVLAARHRRKSRPT